MKLCCSPLVTCGSVDSAVLKLNVDWTQAAWCTCGVHLSVLALIFFELDSWLWRDRRPENVTSPTWFRLQAAGCRLTWPSKAIDHHRTRDSKTRCRPCKIILFRNGCLMSKQNEFKKNNVFCNLGSVFSCWIVQDCNKIVLDVNTSLAPAFSSSAFLQSCSELVPNPYCCFRIIGNIQEQSIIKALYSLKGCMLPIFLNVEVLDWWAVLALVIYI